MKDGEKDYLQDKIHLSLSEDSYVFNEVRRMMNERCGVEKTTQYWDGDLDAPETMDEADKMHDIYVECENEIIIALLKRMLEAFEK